jgi:hypothetical protein
MVRCLRVFSRAGSEGQPSCTRHSIGRHDWYRERRSALPANCTAIASSTCPAADIAGEIGVGGTLGIGGADTLDDASGGVQHIIQYRERILLPATARHRLQLHPTLEDSDPDRQQLCEEGVG